jgi:protein TonB
MRSDEDLLDFVSNYRDARPQGRKRFLIWVALLIHAVVLAASIGLPLLEVDRDLPQVESMATFLVPPPQPPPPPPPPAPAPARPQAAEKLSRPLLREASFVAPVAIPSQIPTEDFGGGDFGVPGGVEGGVPGGIAGGIARGLPESPASPPRPDEPVRVDFRRDEGRPIKKVDPVYPTLAVESRVQGVVILDVLVDAQGIPGPMKVLKTVPMLEDAATTAVRAWRWKPYVIEDQPVPFWVTVTVTFRLA